MNHKIHLIYLMFLTVVLGITAAFALYWFMPSHIPNNFTGNYRVLDVSLFMIVSYILWHPILMNILAWAITSHIKDVTYEKPRRGLRVAFITTYVPGSESPELLHKTLPAMVAANYKHDTWILDEGDDPTAKAICEQYGVKHFSRHGIDRYNEKEGKFARKTKGGNHNAWYDTYGNDYDIVAQIDTDFIPRADFLTKSLGFFNNPKVGWVGTPQIYGNGNESIIAQGAAEQTYNFYGPILRGLDGMNTTMLIGANHIIRVEALKSVDHYSAHITEDLLTGMKLHASGWESRYIPLALAIGEGPSTWKAYFSQQKRWAYGCMDILFAHSGKLLPQMKFRRMLYYFLIQQHYFSGVAMVLSIACLSVYFAFGLNASDVELAPFMSVYLPTILTGFLLNLWIQRFNVRPKEERGLMLSGMYIGVAAWPIFFMAFLELFKKKQMEFSVTPKGKKARRQPVPYAVFVPHILIGTIALIGYLSGLTTGRDAPLMQFWALLTAFLMFLVPVVAPVINRSKQRAVLVKNTAPA